MQTKMNNVKEYILLGRDPIDTPCPKRVGDDWYGHRIDVVRVVDGYYLYEMEPVAAP